MKFRKDREDKDFRMFVKACIVIVAIGIAVFSLGQRIIGAQIVLTGFLMIVLAFLFGKEHYFQDERTRRAREKASSKAYIATLIALLFLMAFGNIIPEIKNANYWDVTSFIFFVGLLPFLIYDWYYKRGEYNEDN